MVDFNFQPSQQFLTKRERVLARVRENNTAGRRLRVEPANDVMREILRHPTAGFFRGKGAAEWPDDKFTQRRLRDGDIKLAEDQRTTRNGSQEKAPQQSAAPTPPTPPAPRASFARRQAEPRRTEPPQAAPAEQPELAPAEQPET
jgi:hypothetical protein